MLAHRHLPRGRLPSEPLPDHVHRIRRQRPPTPAGGPNAVTLAGAVPLSPAGNVGVSA